MNLKGLIITEETIGSLIKALSVKTKISLKDVPDVKIATKEDVENLIKNARLV